MGLNRKRHTNNTQTIYNSITKAPTALGNAIRKPCVACPNLRLVGSFENMLSFRELPNVSQSWSERPSSRPVARRKHCACSPPAVLNP